MDEKKDQLLAAFRVLAEAEMSMHKQKDHDQEDAIESYMHHQILQIFKEFPDLPAALLQGYELLKGSQ